MDKTEVNKQNQGCPIRVVHRKIGGFECANEMRFLEMYTTNTKKGKKVTRYKRQ